MRRSRMAIVMTVFFSLFLLFLASPSESYYGSYPTTYPPTGYAAYGSYPTTYPTTGPYSYYGGSSNYYSPATNYSLPPITINLNINSLSYDSQSTPQYGGLSTGGTNYYSGNPSYGWSSSPYPLIGPGPTTYPTTPVRTPSASLVAILGPSPSLVAIPGPLTVPTVAVPGPLTAPTVAIPTTVGYPATYDFPFTHSASDGEYIYAAFQERGIKGRTAVAIFKSSDSGDCEYLSEITLYDKSTTDDSDSPPAVPDKLLIRGDLAIIGTAMAGTVYLVDISDKENPKLLNTLVLGKDLQEDETGNSRVSGLAVENQVLFASVYFSGQSKNIIYALDISDPANTDAEGDLLDSFVLEEEKGDYCSIYGMASIPGYLYISGVYKDDPAVLVMDISDPANLSLVNTLKTENEIRSVTVSENGGYLFGAVAVTEQYGPYEDGSFELTVISINDPENPQIISSSVELTGSQIFGYENIVVKDNYAYVATTSTSMPSRSKIYVFDVSNPEKPTLVESSKNIDGLGLNLYLASGNLCLHTENLTTGTTKNMTIFDISDPENLSVIKSIDLGSILGDALDGWGMSNSGSASGYTPVSYPVGYISPAYGYGYPPSYPVGYGGLGVNYPTYGYGYGGTGILGPDPTNGYGYGQSYSYVNPAYSGSGYYGGGYSTYPTTYGYSYGSPGGGFWGPDPTYGHGYSQSTYVNPAYAGSGYYGGGYSTYPTYGYGTATDMLTTMYAN
jgi:hypothetical protein